MNSDIYVQFGKRLASLRQEKGLSQHGFAKILGIPQSTYAGYEIGNRKIPLELIERFAHALDVSATYLVTGNDNSSKLADTYSPSEKSLIEKYRALDEHGKKAVDFIVEHELVRNEIKQAQQQNACVRETQPRQLPLYDLPVSAGSGEFLDSSHYEIIDVGSKVPIAANFGVRISGDSMEPQIYDGDIVWVKQQQYLEDGEIGIFILNNEGFCKKYRISEDDCRLVSLNKKYSDIVIQEYDECRIFGKVL